MPFARLHLGGRVDYDRPMPEVIDQKLLRSLLVLGSVVEARDAYTGGHLWRVGHYARLLATSAGLDDSGVFLAGVGGFLHDIGKIGVPDAILRKPAALDAAEYAVIRTHPMVGHDLLREHPLAYLALDAVTYHHERADGHGYPAGLFGDETPLVARIVSIADAFDAMTSSRPYRRALPVEVALRNLVQAKGRQFDAALVERFVAAHAAGQLDGVLGFSHHDRPLAVCSHCGPVIAVPPALKEGDLVPCRSCAGVFRIHRRGRGFEAEWVGRTDDPELLKPQADLEAVAEFAGVLPASYTAV